MKRPTYIQATDASQGQDLKGVEFGDAESLGEGFEGLRPLHARGPRHRADDLHIGQQHLTAAGVEEGGGHDRKVRGDVLAVDNPYGEPDHEEDGGDDQEGDQFS